VTLWLFVLYFLILLSEGLCGWNIMFVPLASDVYNFGTVNEETVTDLQRQILNNKPHRFISKFLTILRLRFADIEVVRNKVVADLQ
jgi:hypothetical protein